MKNIHELLKTVGVEIPEDKKAEFDKAVSENYKTVNEVENIRTKLGNVEKERDDLKSQYEADIQKRDADLKAVQDQLQNAGVDKSKLEELQNNLVKQKEDYEASKKDYEAKLAKQQYEFAVKEKVAEIKFSSISAKKAFIADLMQNPLQVKDGKLLGFDDFVNGYKEQDAGAFVSEDDSKDKKDPEEGKKPVFSSKSGKQEDEPSGKSGEDKKERPVIW